MHCSVLLQDAITGISGRVGRSRPVCQRRAPVEAHDQFIGLHSGPGHPGWSIFSKVVMTGTVRQLRAAMKRQKEALIDLVTRHFPRDVRLTRPEGGYFVWIDMPWDTVDALAVYRKALANQISIAPGPMFSNHGGFHNCLRPQFRPSLDASGRTGHCHAGPDRSRTARSAYKGPCGRSDADRWLIRSCFCGSDPGAQNSSRSRKGMPQTKKSCWGSASDDSAVA